jgi:acyl-CoA reductase-like NAD-dependent aldehyde dehydrogenase
MMAESDSRPMLEGRMYVDGEWLDGGKGSIDVDDPSTESIIGQVAEASVEDAADAAAAARAGQPRWAATKPSERGLALAAIAQKIRDRRDPIAELSMRESGFTRPVASFHIDSAAAWFEYAAAVSTQDHSIAMPHALVAQPDGRTELLNGSIQRRPVGVVACLVPFNAPFLSASLKASQALAMGNAVVVKPAPQNPLAVCELFKIIDEVGLPQGAANLITSLDPNVGAELTRSPDVDMVSFTGSSQVGKLVYAAGAQSMKRLILELGGKGACLVFEDADLDAAARGLANVWRVNTGQVCSSPTRAIVHRGVYDRLLEKLQVIAGTVQVGSPFDAKTVAGPVISNVQRERIEAFVGSARSEGAEVVVGGTRPDFDAGYYVAPTLLAGCNNTMGAVRNEIFGPVITVLPFDTDDEAIAIANDSEYGLASYVYSQDRAHAFAVGSRIQSGTVQLNTVSMKPDMPRGGMKMSGYGRECGEIGLHAYTEMASIVWS